MPSFIHAGRKTDTAKLRAVFSNSANRPNKRAGDDGVFRAYKRVCGNEAYQFTHVLVQSCTHRPKLLLLVLH